MYVLRSQRFQGQCKLTDHEIVRSPHKAYGYDENDVIKKATRKSFFELYLKSGKSVENTMKRFPEASMSLCHTTSILLSPITKGGTMLVSTGTRHWYAVRTRSRAEKVVRNQLARRGVEPLLPLLSRTSQWKDRKKLIEWPLFQGYCFAKMGPEQKSLVLQAPGVIELVGSGGRPEPIPEAEMTAIMCVIQSRRPYEPYPYFEEGMWVEVIRGPLQGLRGKFVRHTNHCRLVMSISLIRHATSVEINAEDIAPLDLGLTHCLA